MSAQENGPDFATLLDWVEGRLAPDAAKRVAAQVADADEGIRRTADWLREFLAAARALPLHQPPPIVRQSLTQYFARWSRATAALDQRAREVPVRLLFDSRQDLALAGVRAGASDEEAVHLVYSAQEGDLLLDVYRRGPGVVRLAGQVLLAESAGAPNFQASVAGAGFSVRTMDGDQLGRFSLREVPEGPCQLRATNGVVTLLAGLRLHPGGE